MKKKLSNLLYQKAVMPFRVKLLLILLVAAFTQVNAFAQNVNIFVTPASTTISSGQSFTVNVRFDITSGSINAAEVHLDFNNSRLQVTNITRPNSAQFSSETIAIPAGPYDQNHIINTSGQINYAAGMPAGSTSTDFDMLAITFTTATPVVAGSTPLTLVNVPGRRTRAVLGSTVATGTLTSGTVSVCSAPSATITASSGSSICNSQPVALSLSAATGGGPYTLVVDGITYNNVNVGANFATIPFPTFNIFPSNPVPVMQNVIDNGEPIEVGMKFRSTTSGFIKGIRFYKGNSVTESYTGKLYNYGTGQLIGSATFSPSANGWVQVLFATPVSIAANTTYIASYYSTSGRYSHTDDYFCTSGGSCVGGVFNGPLSALQDNGVGGANGIYRLGAGGGIPNNTFASANYFVDVIFTSSSNQFNLTSVTSSTGCTISGALQTVNVVSAECSTLPVTLLNLSASPQGNKITLRWTTSSEINNRGFDVQRSTDGANWTTIGFVAGVGNSSTSRNYTYMDQNLEPRKYYYRLKQIDIDDRFKLSAVVSASLNGKAEFSLGQNYPNPFNNQTTIQFILPKAENVNLSLFDVSGRVVKVLVNASKEAGTHAINLNTGNLTKGVYYYKIQAGDFTDVKKLTIQ